jgi:hypothetical protein
LLLPAGSIVWVASSGTGLRVSVNFRPADGLDDVGVAVEEGVEIGSAEFDPFLGFLDFFFDFPLVIEDADGTESDIFVGETSTLSNCAMFMY